MAPPMVYLHAEYDSLVPYVYPARLGSTLVLVPYAYPAYERQQRKAVGLHTSNSFAFVVFFINEMPFIKRCGYGSERLGWRMLCAQ